MFDTSKQYAFCHRNTHPTNHLPPRPHSTLAAVSYSSTRCGDNTRDVTKDTIQTVRTWAHKHTETREKKHGPHNDATTSHNHTSVSQHNPDAAAAAAVTTANNPIGRRWWRITTTC